MRPVTHVITTIERGGAENQLLVVARTQVESGRRVVILPLKGKPELHEEFIAIGAEVNLSLLNSNPLLQIFLLTRFLATERTQVHAHLPRAELIVSMVPTKVDFVVTRHNSERFFPGKPAIFSILLSRFVVMRGGSVIAISQAVIDFMRGAHELPRMYPVDLVYYGYDRNFLDSRAKKPLISRSSTSQRILGTIGRLVPQKDYHTLLNAFHTYLKVNPEATLVILGVGYLEAELKMMALHLGISDKITWIGKSDNVIDYLKEFDLLLLTSSYEGFGLVLLEAMLAQVPVIASRNSAIPEVLGEQHPGLCQTGNFLDFSKRLTEFESPALVSEVIQAQDARLNIFSPEKMRQSLDLIYDRT